MGPTTASTALSRAQVARALRVARGAGEAAADSGVAAAPVGAPVPKAAACITAMLVVAGTLAVAGITGSPGPGPDSGELGPSATPPEGSILRGSPGTAAIQPPSSRQEHSKMFGKLTGVAAATAVGVSTAVANGQGAAVQWRVEDGGNGHWYRHVNSVQNWVAAQAFAQSLGGHLATMTSAAENRFVFAASGSGGNSWIGGLQDPTTCEPGCGWHWITGEPWDYTAWRTSPEDGPGASQPDNTSGNEHHLAYWGGIPKWNDGDGHNVAAPFTIEWSADCNNDGIVDYGQCRDGSLPDYDGDNVPDCCEAGSPCVTGNYPVQWRVEDGGNGHWYEIFNRAGEGKIDWLASRATAVERGGDLATFTSEAETNAFLSMTSGQTQGNPWIGLFEDPAGGWRWATGEPLAWTNWAPTEPSGDGDWANMWIDYGPAGMWNDYRPTNPQGPDGFVVEWSADCNNDGIVDYGQILRGDFADVNRNGIPDGACECLGDVLLDRDINGADLGAVLFYWGPAPAGSAARACDFNADGQVDGADLGILLAAWGPCPG